jgi:hypothetical protein
LTSGECSLPPPHSSAWLPAQAIEHWVEVAAVVISTTLELAQ